MSDFFEQFKRQQKINEGLFGSLFNKEEPKKDNTEFYQTKDGTYVFGGKSTAKKIVVPATKEFLEDYPWSTSKLRFVVAPETEFHANTVNFDLDEDMITFFDGEWKSGPFIGKRFHGTFSGLYFIGNFMDLYSNYKSEPNTFTQGTFYDLSNKGILGKPNTLTLDSLKDNDVFLLITIPVGYKIQMRSANGVDSSIRVLKRLDKDSSMFQFEVNDGFSGKKGIVNVDWQTIKNLWGKGIYEIPKKMAKNVGNLVIATGEDYIKEMYVSESEVTFQSPASQAAQSTQQIFAPGKKYAFNLSEIPLLNISSIRGEKGKFAGSTSPNVTFSFDTQEEFKQFNNIISNIKNGGFQQDLNNIAKAIKYKEVDGYGPYLYLKNIFNSQGNMLKEANKNSKGMISNPGLKIGPSNKKSGQFSATSKKQKPLAQVADQSQSTVAPVPDINQSMARLNSFVYYFVENIVTKKGVSNEVVKNIIFNNLKRVLGIQSIDNKSVNPVSQVVKNIEPGAKNTDIDFSATKMQESIRISVRNIINDSF